MTLPKQWRDDPPEIVDDGAEFGQDYPDLGRNLQRGVGQMLLDAWNMEHDGEDYPE